MSAPAWAWAFASTKIYLLRKPRFSIAGSPAQSRQHSPDTKKGSRSTGSLSSVLLCVSYWQVGNLKDASRVCQLNVPFEAMYSFAYQNVQSSDGSRAMLL